MPLIKNPVTASWGLSLDDKDFIKLKHGCIARDMDDRWAFIPITEKELSDELSARKLITSDRVSIDKVQSDKVQSDKVQSDKVQSDKVQSGKVQSGKVQSGKVQSDKVQWENLPSSRLLSDKRLLAEIKAEIEASREKCNTVEPDAEKMGPPPAKFPSEEDLRQGGYISIRRTWTNTELYRLVLTVQPSEGGGIKKGIEAITWEQNQGPHYMSEEQAKIDVVILCRSQLECDLTTAPDHNAEEFSGHQSIAT